MLFVGIVIALFRMDTGDAPEPPPPTPTEVVIQVTPTPTVVTRPTAEATAIPEEETPEPIAADCDAGCLVRIPATDEVADLLASAAERPSWENDDWLWAIVRTPTIDALEAEATEVVLVQDSPETLYLYATRLPQDARSNAVVENFGEVLDEVDGHSIVRAPSVPAVVTDLVNAGVWVEKVEPAPPSVAGLHTAGTGSPISGIDVGALLPEVDAGRMEQVILELQAMSSTDGTGIGTRHYTTTGNVMAGEFLFREMESYGLRVWYEDFITPEGMLSTNVIGEIPGRDDSAIYGVMAHYDSIGYNFAEAPGADDNGTGIAGALEIARILSAYELKHPIHIVFVNAEETAIIGSMAYAERVVAEGTPIEGIYNLDTVGTANYGTRLIVNSGPQSAWMTDLLIRVNDGYGLGQDIWARQNPAIVADDNMLRNQNIEAVLVARLMAGDYSVHHSPDDTIDNLSMPHTISATQLVLLALAALVQ